MGCFFLELFLRLFLMHSSCFVIRKPYRRTVCGLRSNFNPHISLSGACIQSIINDFENYFQVFSGREIPAIRSNLFFFGNQRKKDFHFYPARFCNESKPVHRLFIIHKKKPRQSWLSFFSISSFLTAQKYFDPVVQAVLAMLFSKLHFHGGLKCWIHLPFHSMPASAQSF